MNIKSNPRICEEIMENNIKEKQINYEDIFKSNYAIEKRNLFKYFAKHAGCKIVTGQIPYNVEDLREFIRFDKSSEEFILQFQIKEGIKSLMDKIPGYYHLYNGPANYIQLSSEFGFTGWLSYHWFTTNWFYSSELNQLNRINDNKTQKVELKRESECINQENKLNIHRIEYCGLETVDKIKNKFILMTEKVYL